MAAARDAPAASASLLQVSGGDRGDRARTGRAAVVCLVRCFN